MAGEANPAGQIQEFLRVLKRRRWQITLPALFVLAFGTAFAVVVPKKYVVETEIEVKESRNPWDYEGKNRNESVTSREIENVGKHIINYARIERIVSKQLISQWPEYKRADAGTRKEIIESVMKNIAVEKAEKAKEIGSTFFLITYKDVVKKRAEGFLRELNTAWIEEIIQRDLDDLILERDVLAAELEDATAVQAEANSAWVEQCLLLNINPATSPDSRDQYGNATSDYEYEQLAQYQREQQQNFTDLARAESKLTLLEAQYREEPEGVVAVDLREGEKFDAQILKHEAKIDELEEQLSGITEAHREYRVLSEQIVELEQKVAELGRQETADATVERLVPNPRREELRYQVQEGEVLVGNLLSERTRLAEKIEEFDGRVAQRAEDFQLASGFFYAKQEALKNRTRVSALLADKKSAIRVFEESQARVYEVVKKPVAADDSVEPSPMLLVAVALFLGAALGLAIAIAAEYGRNSYRTVSDLATVMAVPVLGSIQEIVTPTERRRTRAGRAVVGVSSAVILLGVAWISYCYADEARREGLPVPLRQAIEDFRLTLM